LLGSFHIKYSTIAFGYMPGLMGRIGFVRIRQSRGPEAVRSRKSFPGVNTKLGTASSIYKALVLDGVVDKLVPDNTLFQAIQDYTERYYGASGLSTKAFFGRRGGLSRPSSNHDKAFGAIRSQ
jgi:hypothetical protein